MDSLFCLFYFKELKKKSSQEPQNVITSRKSSGDTGRKVGQVLKKVEFKKKKCGKRERNIRIVWEVQDQIERGTAEKNWGKTEGNMKHDRINT